MRTTGAGQSPLLLFDVVDALNHEKIDYAVVGAMAGSVHGSIRASVDADAIISVPIGKLVEMERQFENAGFNVELRRGDFDDPIGAVLSLTDSFHNRVDLIAGLRGLDPQAFTRTIEVAYGDQQLRVIGREDFVAMKAFAGGPQDLVDARRVIAAAEKLDVALIRALARRFGRDAVKALDSLLPSEGGGA